MTDPEIDPPIAVFVFTRLSSRPTETGTVSDIDGNVYHTVKIGDQWWMAENLAVKHYRNGDAIPNVPSGSEWSRFDRGAYCDSGSVAVYGLLYNGFAVCDYRKIAPEGWHVPSAADWEKLVNQLGGEDVAGGKMKEVGFVHWNRPNTGATDESGFRGLPSGYRYDDAGQFCLLGEVAVFWSQVSIGIDTRCPILRCWQSYPFFESFNYRAGLSVRCVKDVRFLRD